jgi:hypothetical protein
MQAKLKFNLIVLNIVLLSAWLWTTALVDFVAVPTVFRTLSDLFVAGELGIKIFSKYNVLEMTFASLLLVQMLAIFLLPAKTNGADKILLVAVMALAALAFYYYFFLTPEIVELTKSWKEFFNTADGPAWEQKHTLSHHLYVRLDSIKLVVLLIGLILSFVSLNKSLSIKKDLA